MAEETKDLAPRTPLGQLKLYLKNDDVQQRLKDMLGDRAGAFTNSIINVMSGSRQLAACDPKSVMQSAMIAASVNLPIDPALGFAAIVPYKDTAQFQIMYKGVIQLCIRSGQYQRIHDTEVYQDELRSYNPITGEVQFRELTEYKMRPKHDINDVAGFYVCFKLLKGFEASLYMTKEEVLAHAERYSKAYQYDLRSGKKLCPWSTDPIAMGRKTVILGLLKRYGIMSVEMQDAVAKDAENEYETVQPVESKTIPTDKAARVRFGKKAKPAEDEQTVTDETEPDEQEPDTEVAEDEATEGLDPDAVPENWDDDGPDPTQDVQDAETQTDQQSNVGTASEDQPSNDEPPYICTKCKGTNIQIKGVKGKGQVPFCMDCISWKNVVKNQ